MNLDRKVLIDNLTEGQPDIGGVLDCAVSEPLSVIGGTVVEALGVRREGKPNKLIAQLDMQESMLKVHIRNILKEAQRGEPHTCPFCRQSATRSRRRASRLATPLRLNRSSSKPRHAKAVGA
jgi:hypothetical protein